MDPIRHRARRNPVRPLVLAVAALLVPFGLAACGSDKSDDHAADDPAPTTAAPPTPPTVGTYPLFAADDYTFELSVQCFCAGAGSPVEVTVVDAEVVGAVYGLGGGSGSGGVEPGSDAEPHLWLSINDVIERANDTEAARVEVEWPRGQAYPDRVYVDSDERVADDETGYQISAVVAD